MIYSKGEILNFIKNTLGCKDEDITIAPLKASGNMTAKIEDGGEATLLEVVVRGKEYVLKMKSTAFENSVGIAMNYYDSEDFLESFNRGKYIFYIRNNYDRESKVYSAFSEIKEYLPKVYGAQSDDYRSILLIEKVEISRFPKNKELALVLKKLHAVYSTEEGAKKIGANLHEREDYLKATHLSRALLESIGKVYPTFPGKILDTARGVVEDYGALYDKMTNYRRVVCHGDCTINNMTTAPTLKLYDLELSTYNNPEFDLVSYLVHYPTKISKKEVEEFLFCYYGDEDYMSSKKEVLSLNLIIYFVTRFHAMMMISKKVDMPYMPTSIDNFIYLFQLFGL